MSKKHQINLTAEAGLVMARAGVELDGDLLDSLRGIIGELAKSLPEGASKCRLTESERALLSNLASAMGRRSGLQRAANADMSSDTMLKIDAAIARASGEIRATLAELKATRKTAPAAKPSLAVGDVGDDGL